MSSNPQWKMFQPPDSHPSPLQVILDLQHSNMQAKQAFRKGTYSSEYPSSPRDNYNNMNKSGGGNRISLGNYNLDGCLVGDSAGVYSSSSNRFQYDSMNHPPIRQTGIIEKLLDQGSPKLNRRPLEEKIKRPAFMRENMYLANTIVSLIDRYCEEADDDTDVQDDDEE